MSRTHTPPAPVAIIFSVRLSDGTFESQVSVPINAPQTERQTAVERWMEIMQFGLKLPGAVEISNQIGEAP